MKSIYLTFSLMIIAVVATAQQPVDFETYFHKNHSSIGLHHGFSKANTFPEFGSQKLKEPITYVYYGNYTYNFNLGTYTSLQLTTGLGLFHSNYKYDKVDSFWGTEGNSYFHNVNINPYIYTGAGVEHRLKLSNRSYMALSAGVGFDHSYSYQSTSTSSMFVNDSLSHTFYYREYWTGGSKLNLNGGVSFNRMLKNHDIISFVLNYNHSFQPVFEANYEIFKNTPHYSGGKYINNGHYISAGIAYNFTKVKKMLDMKEQFDRGEREVGKIKREAKKDNWLNRPKDLYYLRAMTGIQFHYNTIRNDEQNVLANSLPVGLSFNLQLQKEFNDKFFWEAGIGHVAFWNGFRFKFEDEKYTSGWGNAFNAIFLNAGGGYRFTTKKQLPIINAEAGVALGINKDFRKDYGNSAGSFTGGISLGPSTFTISYEGKNHYRNKIFPMAYIGASKDFRIRGSLYYTLLYRYYQGFSPAYESKMIYTTSETTSPSTADVIINGSSHHIQMGLKYGIGELWQKK